MRKEYRIQNMYDGFGYLGLDTSEEVRQQLIDEEAADNFADEVGGRDMHMLYIIVADVKYYEGGPSVQSYLNIQDEGVFWDDESMEVWDEYYRATSYQKDIKNNRITFSRNYAEVKNIRVGRIQIAKTE